MHDKYRRKQIPASDACLDSIERKSQSMEKESKSKNPMSSPFLTGIEMLQAGNERKALDFLDKLNESFLPVAAMFANYRCAIMEVETKLRVLDTNFSVQYDYNPIESIKSRLKTPDSILRKMEARGYPLTLQSMSENVRDIAGVRVICSFADDIYRLADCLLEQDDIILVEKKDYIRRPKSNGYRSLHLIVQVPIFTEKEKKLMYVEVQLRTIAMDFWASLEHKIRYKKNLSVSVLEELSAELYACAEVSAELDERMQAVRSKLNKI